MRYYGACITLNHTRYNLLAKIGLYGQEHPERAVRGVLAFLRKHEDAGAPPVATNPHLIVAYLDELLPDWLAREPDNPFVAVFIPLILRRDDELLAGAPQAWQAIQQAPLPAPTRAALERMLECWLIERFPTLTTEELRAMFLQRANWLVSA